MPRLDPQRLFEREFKARVRELRAGGSDFDLTLKGPDMQKKKFRDPRNDETLVYSPNGAEHKMTLTNAREMVRLSGWSMIAPKGFEPQAPATETAAIEPVAAPVVVVDDAAAMAALGKDVLRTAATALKISFDGRSNEAKLVQTIDGVLDGRLTALGDFEGGAEDEEGDADADKAEKAAARAARRRRAYAAEAIKLELPFTAEATIVSLVQLLGAAKA